MAYLHDELDNLSNSDYNPPSIKDQVWPLSQYGYPRSQQPLSPSPSIRPNTVGPCGPSDTDQYYDFSKYHGVRPQNGYVTGFNNAHPIYRRREIDDVPPGTHPDVGKKIGGLNVISNQPGVKSREWDKIQEIKRKNQRNNDQQRYLNQTQNKTKLQHSDFKVNEREIYPKMTGDDLFKEISRIRRETQLEVDYTMGRQGWCIDGWKEEPGVGVKQSNWSIHGGSQKSNQSSADKENRPNRNQQGQIQNPNIMKRPGTVPNYLNNGTSESSVPGAFDLVSANGCKPPLPSETAQSQVSQSKSQIQLQVQEKDSDIFSTASTDLDSNTKEFPPPKEVLLFDKYHFFTNNIMTGIGRKRGPRSGVRTCDNIRPPLSSLLAKQNNVIPKASLEQTDYRINMLNDSHEVRSSCSSVDLENPVIKPCFRKPLKRKCYEFNPANFDNEGNEDNVSVNSNNSSKRPATVGGPPPLTNDPLNRSHLKSDFPFCYRQMDLNPLPSCAPRVFRKRHVPFTQLLKQKVDIRAMQ